MGAVFAEAAAVTFAPTSSANEAWLNKIAEMASSKPGCLRNDRVDTTNLLQLTVNTLTQIIH
jgi:hypothetical protein